MARTCTTAFSWASMLLLTVPLALGMLLALPTGVPIQIAMHVVLLVAGAAFVLAMQPRDD